MPIIVESIFIIIRILNIVKMRDSCRCVLCLNYPDYVLAEIDKFTFFNYRTTVVAAAGADDRSDEFVRIRTVVVV